MRGTNRVQIVPIVGRFGVPHGAAAASPLIATFQRAPESHGEAPPRPRPPWRVEGPLVLWRPQPGPQAALLRARVFDLLYGGARGGGKTDGMLGEWLDHAEAHGAAATGLFLRRTLVQLDEAMARARELFRPRGAVWRAQKKEFGFPGGARLKFRYLRRDSDAEGYQGHSYSRVYVEELTNFPDPRPVDRLKATLRSAAGAHCGFRATANPGGPGHHWVKARYIDPSPEGWDAVFDGHGLDRLFIPARLADNRMLTANDPGYSARLRQSGSAELVRAWLEGDWSIVQGAYFDGWRPDRHVATPLALPADWIRFCAFDWGSARPFSVGWYAVSDGTLPRFAKDCLVRFAEWYGAAGPNTGLKLDAEEVARRIVERERPMAGTIDYRVADPAIFRRDSGPSIAERMTRATDGRIVWRPGDNQRIAGWDQIRSRLEGEDGRPMLAVFSTCTELIRTLPALPHDEARPEDAASDVEDHAADELRYACMSRPYSRPAPESAEPRWPRDMSFHEIVRERGRSRTGTERI